MGQKIKYWDKNTKNKLILAAMFRLAKIRLAKGSGL